MGKFTQFHRFTHRSAIELQQKLGNSIPVCRVIGMAITNGAQTFAFEEDPEETEYKKEYAVLYKNITAYNACSTPNRIHFFSSSVKNVQDAKDEDYMGFIDIRPIHSKSISWALLDKRLLVGSHNQRFLYMTCGKEYQVDVDNRTFKINAFPYVQQDGVCVRCAQAALATIAGHFGTDMTGPSFTEETALLSEHGQRTIPSYGLNCRQVCAGIRALDREPVPWDLDNLSDNERLEILEHVYYYVESGIPVILALKTADQAHALVAVGHTFTPDSWTAIGERSYFGFPNTSMSSQWVRRFVVQDDNFGPYTLIPADVLRAVCFLAVVPLPKHVYLVAEEAVRIAKYLLSQDGNDLLSAAYGALDESLEESEKKLTEITSFWREKLCEAIIGNDLILRPRLMTGEAWKKENAGGPLAYVIDEALDEIAIPEYVWRFELSWPQIFCHQRLLIGQLVLDATHPFSLGCSIPDQQWLWLRSPGLIVTRNVISGKAGIWPITADEGPEEHHQHE